MNKKILKIKDFEDWHKKYKKIAIPCDDIRRKLKGFINVDTDEYVLCERENCLISEYFQKIERKRKKEQEFEEKIISIVRKYFGRGRCYDHCCDKD